jgi:hypothetical protein
MSMTVEPGHEKRRYRRIRLSVPARFLVDDGAEQSAQLLDISAGGLALSADERPDVGSPIVIYIDELGRVEGRVVRHLAGGFAVEFDATEAKRERLSVRLTWLANRPQAGDTAKPGPIQAKPGDRPCFILEDGREVQCRVLDMSVHGVCLEVATRPSIGSEVTIGRMRGRIARHHAAGVEVEFVR